MGWSEVKPSETLLNRHSIQLAACFSMGEGHDEVERVNSALKSTENSPPPVYFMFKDHKRTEDGEPCPQTRPTCGAKDGPLVRLSHLASQILTPVADRLSDDMGTECSSTEEMMRGIEDANTNIRDASLGLEINDRREIVVISQDVKALYPSLDWETVIWIVGKILEETDITFAELNYRQIGKYLAINLTQEQIAESNLKSVIPKKIKPNRAGMAFLDADLDKRGDEKWGWGGKRREPSNLQKKRMVARSMEVVVKTILGNHLYQMDGKVYRQQGGGPIGLEITGVLSRLVMLWWDKVFLQKLERVGINLIMYKRYVDDGNLALEAVESGKKFLMENFPFILNLLKRISVLKLTEELQG